MRASEGKTVCHSLQMMTDMIWGIDFYFFRLQATPMFESFEFEKKLRRSGHALLTSLFMFFKTEISYRMKVQIRLQKYLVHLFCACE